MGRRGGEEWRLGMRVRDWNLGSMLGSSTGSGNSQLGWSCGDGKKIGERGAGATPWLGHRCLGTKEVAGWWFLVRADLVSGLAELGALVGLLVRNVLG